MSIDLKNPKEPSVTSLVTGIISDVEDLFKQQFELLKHDVRDDIRKTRDAGFTLAAGGGIGLVGALLLVQMLVYLTQWFVPDLPLWVCFGIWGVLMFGAGAVLVFIGKNTLESVNPLEDKSAQALKENVQWITNPK
jgi:hypothetical protein